MSYGAYVAGEELPAADANKGFVPIGTVLPFAGSSAPSSWIFCYGQAISRATYAALFAIIGTTFGAGDGSTTFNVPDMRGNMILGKDDMGGSSRNRVVDADADTLGGQDGSETVTLTTSQIPSHTHGVRGVTTSTGSDTGAWRISGSNVVFTADITTDGGTGGGQAHNNMPPYITLNYIIRY